ncbi:MULTISPECIES: HPr family phosphocarrier protein [Thermococcus]|jgi:phosphotransferase system HPr (HPr) family protein|uniref:PTS family porter component HPr n=1 Tax=Thermococcus sibiricus TaxID=172049 RepID=A0A101EKJ7_9EURY|nr:MULTISPECIES: HPr family phosphocarrier protein [Thermococcus]KUK16963.1 MAG: PTS family porter component HPr [Thermococcus sibiricus]MCA6214160.1 HPr family phosphocarrier protein [Thermococcus bergensis]
MKRIVKKMTITNPEGLHARPAGKLVKLLSKVRSTVKIKYKDKTVDAKSVLSLLTLGIDPGEEVEVIIEGDDAEEALKLVEGVVSGNN